MQELENKGTSSVQQPLQATNERETKIKKLDMVSTEIDHLIGSSDLKAFYHVIAMEDPIIVAPHIDFVLGDQPLILGDCKQMVHDQQWKHLMVKTLFNLNSKIRSSASNLLPS